MFFARHAVTSLLEILSRMHWTPIYAFMGISRSAASLLANHNQLRSCFVCCLGYVLVLCSPFSRIRSKLWTVDILESLGTSSTSCNFGSIISIYTSCMLWLPIPMIRLLFLLNLHYHSLLHVSSGGNPCISSWWNMEKTYDHDHI